MAAPVRGPCSKVQDRKPNDLIHSGGSQSSRRADAARMLHRSASGDAGSLACFGRSDQRRSHSEQRHSHFGAQPQRDTLLAIALWGSAPPRCRPLNVRRPNSECNNAGPMRGRHSWRRKCLLLRSLASDRLSEVHSNPDKLRARPRERCVPPNPLWPSSGDCVCRTGRPRLRPRR